VSWFCFWKYVGYSHTMFWQYIEILRKLRMTKEQIFDN
jgi:hypothetical protein